MSAPRPNASTPLIEENFHLIYFASSCNLCSNELKLMVYPMNVCS